MNYIWNHQPAIPLDPAQERKVHSMMAEIERRQAAKRLAAVYETIGQAKAAPMVFDALDRPLSGDWIKDCAQAKEARMMKERHHG